MTRKRFVKLMMSHGVDRNRAGVMAYIAIAKYGSYEAAYTSQMVKLAASFKVVNDVSQAIVRVANAIACGINAFSTAVSHALGDADGQ